LKSLRRHHCFVALGVLGACAAEPSAPPVPSEHDSALAVAAPEPIAPLPEAEDFDVPLAKLGEELFSSTILSEDGQISCATCHLASAGMADGRALPWAPQRPAMQTNATTLYNVRYFSKLGWTGRFSDLAQHLNGLIESPKLMATSWQPLLARLRADPGWTQRISSQFSSGVTVENVRTALVEYERSLITPDAPFDRWLLGDRDALSEEAQHGYGLFKSYGCVSCHQGVSVGANLFQRLGVMRDYFAGRVLLEADLGRYNVTHDEQDRYVFRVPSLRNVALTAPYLHDGSATTLAAVVQVMADAQLGIHLDELETAAIIAFLVSLTGQYRGQAL